jgi:hexosaminidase
MQLTRTILLAALTFATWAGSIHAAGPREAMATPFDHPVLAAWQKTAEAPSYDEATADDPHYNDDVLWPAFLEMDGKPAYMSQSWKPVRVMVWNRRDADKRSGSKVNLMDPANWLVDGKVAKRPPDPQTDVVFPSAEKPYYVHTSHGDKYKQALPCRHVTVGTNANVSVFGCRPTGNWWIKKGGSIYERHGGGFRGARTHTFARNDNVPAYRPGLGLLRPGKWTDEQAPLLDAISQYIHIQKPGGSLEAVGNWSTTDQFHVDAGTFIIGPRSAVGTGGRATLVVHRDGVLQLQSGSVISKRFNQTFNWDMIVEGALRAGSEARPIREDAIVGISAKDYVGEVDSLRNYRSRLGMQIKPEATVTVHRASDSDARLVFQWHGIDLNVLRQKPQEPDSRWYDAWKQAIDAEPHFPRVITLDLPSDLQLEHVAFDDVSLGGIHGVTAEQVAAWKDVQWRRRNQGDVDWMIAPGDWYQNIVSRQGWPTVQIPQGEPLLLELASPSPDVNIHYTTDGSEPTAESPTVDGPIRISETTSVRARAFAGKTPMGEPMHLSALSTDKPLPAVEGGKKPGLRFRAGILVEEDGTARIVGQDGKPAAGGTVEAVTADPAKEHGDGGNQAMVLTGYIDAPNTGVYELTLKPAKQADVEVEIGGIRVLVVPNGKDAASRRIALAAGQHTFKLTYRRGWHGSFECRLLWTPPEGEQTTVPADAYTH